MFRCRSFPGQYPLLTLEQRRSLGSNGSESRSFGIRHSPVVTDRGYFGAVRLRSAAGRNAGTASPIPGDEIHNEFAGGEARRFLRRAEVRVLPQPTGRVAQLAEQCRCRQFPGELASLTATNT